MINYHVFHIIALLHPCGSPYTAVLSHLDLIFVKHSLERVLSVHD